MAPDAVGDLAEDEVQALRNEWYARLARSDKELAKCVKPQASFLLCIPHLSIIPLALSGSADQAPFLLLSLFPSLALSAAR